MSVMALAWVLVSCDVAPYEDYWPDAGAAPQITGLEPAYTGSLRGGGELRVQGSRLANATTVIVGGRNAEILESNATELKVLLPDGPVGGGSVNVSVVTDDGMDTLDKGFRYETPLGETVSDELISAVLVRLDCPIESWAISEEDDQWYPIWWCGLEMGEAWALGWSGAGGQSGFAGDLAGYAEISSLPEEGEVAVWGPGERRPPLAPEVYSSHAEGESVSVTTPRDFARDIAFLENQYDLLSYRYYWYEDIVDWSGPQVTLWDDDTCWVEDLPVTDGEGNLLSVEGATAGATGAWLGFSITEDWNGENYEYEGVSGTASVEASGGDLLGSPSGASLDYDSWSGWYLADGVAGTLGLSDFPFGVEYSASLENLFGEEPLGTMEVVDELDLVQPRLMIGDVDINLEMPLSVQWTAGEASEDPVLVVVDLRIYDASVDDPNWMTELYRVTAWAQDSAEELTISEEVLSALPAAPNAIDVDDELTGLWGELTVARHQLHRFDTGNGGLVVDFLHAINAPVSLSHLEGLDTR